MTARPRAHAALVTRVAAIDIGTNSTRLLVADVEGRRVDEVVRRGDRDAARRGRRRVAAAAAGGDRARASRCSRDYRDESSALGAERTLAVATSAVRDAENGAEFLAEVERRFGFATRVLSGDEEAELTRRGVGALDATTLVVDVGGGSTELILGDVAHEPRRRLGAAHRALPPLDPPTPAELDAAAAHVAGLLPELEVDAPRSASPEPWPSSRARRRADRRGRRARDRAARVAHRSPSARAGARLDPARAPVIVAGALIVAEVLRRYGLPSSRSACATCSTGSRSSGRLSVDLRE